MSQWRRYPEPSYVPYVLPYHRVLFCVRARHFPHCITCSVVMPYYAVRRGTQTGIYSNWQECEQRVTRYSGAQFKKFNTQREAEAYMSAPGQGSANVQSRFGGGCAAPAPQPIGRSSGAASAYQPSSSYQPKVSGYKQLPKKTFGPPRDQVQPYPHLSDAEVLASIASPYSTSSSSGRGVNSSGTSTTRSSGVARVGQTEHPQIPSRVLERARLAKADDYDFTPDGFAKCYTDGSCMGQVRNAGVGAWFGPQHVANISEPLPIPGTNNRAELMAVLYAVNAAKESGLNKVEIRTDSKYTIKCLTEWLPKWKQNNWQTAANTNVENQAEIRAIEKACSSIDVRFEWTEGHSGNVGNEAADTLAKRGAAEALGKL
ncbi:unnamed protein product [Notodromas monacha]|uniref:ribonuclease H n=1 Tax=Notodromas monacha TaxID=399045 RepID=A0A7R9BS01_9CRUS|nr:unnamed protein product [Notodromas monacha]CAG0919548.1 unnamed protein product [Notodromas monacha]